MVEHFDGRMELLHFDQAVETAKDTQSDPVHETGTPAVTA
jgi:hypothetical protein